MIPAWLQRLFVEVKRMPIRKLLKFKPGILALEDRLVPATYVVDSLADASGPFPPAPPPPPVGTVTLRQALTAASATSGNFGGLVADAGADTITFAPALAGQTINLTGFTSAASGNSYFRIATDLTIDASALTNLTIHRNSGGAFRFFELDNRFLVVASF